MATADQIIRRAFRKISVLAEDEELTADQFSTGLDALNDMLAGFELRGANVGHLELAPGSDTGLPDAFNEGLTYMLAERLAPNYERPAAFDADDWFRTFQAYFMQIPEAEIPRALRVTSSQRVWRG